MKRAFSRRSFLKQTAFAVCAGSVIGPVGRLWAREQTSGSKQDDLTSALEKALGDQVIGLEKNNRIAHRLAITLATMRGRKAESVARQQILLLAALGIPKGHTSAPVSQPRSVTDNLNDLLKTIRGQRAASQLISTLLAEVATSVLFSSRGIHFDDTRSAHKAFRNAVLALKNKNSDVPIAERIAEKRRLMIAYRSAIFSRAKQVVLLGFPAATIPSVWIMTRSRSSLRKQ